ncbi:hypothetical protein, partial [Paracoccus jiaweipingae]|uniref:hypothetical protein n=1 Tax=unclassified Paracoccus (in: a-proteobacteria) TaxID=2688777 RepID=UPI0037B561CD
DHRVIQRRKAADIAMTARPERGGLFLILDATASEHCALLDCPVIRNEKPAQGAVFSFVLLICRNCFHPCIRNL